MARIIKHTGGVFEQLHKAQYGADIDFDELRPADHDPQFVEEARAVWLGRVQSEFRSIQIMTGFMSDILDAGDLEKTEKWGINDHAAMIEKFEASDVFAETLTDAQVTNLANYFVTLPSEVAMKLWTVLGDTDNIDNVVALHKAEAADGRRVSDHLVEILGGNE